MDKYYMKFSENEMKKHFGYIHDAFKDTDFEEYVNKLNIKNEYVFPMFFLFIFMTNVFGLLEIMNCIILTNNFVKYNVEHESSYEFLALFTISNILEQFLRIRHILYCVFKYVFFSYYLKNTKAKALFTNYIYIGLIDLYNYVFENKLDDKRFESTTPELLDLRTKTK